jgi:predicted nucleic acid-binding protein
VSAAGAERWTEPVYLDASAQLLPREEALRLYREASRLHASSHHAELTPPIHRRAERLMLSLAIPLRALDALHLATALDAEAATVVTFDPRLRDAASSQGVFVVPSDHGDPTGRA